MGKPAPNVNADSLALYEKLVATLPGVERKGAANPYTSVNGHMFSMLTKDGLALRLEEEDRAAFLEKHRTRLCEQYGVVLKEYVLVPDALLRRTRELAKDFERSFRYVSALRPKPTTRKKTTTKRKRTTKK